MKKILFAFIVLAVLFVVGCGEVDKAMVDDTMEKEDAMVEDGAMMEKDAMEDDTMMKDDTMMEDGAMVDNMTMEQMEEQQTETEEMLEEEMAEMETYNDWKDALLKDVATGQTFKISDFKGKPVLLESFAVWCPICTKQQKEIKSLHSEVGDSVVSVSLDTDPHEDESRVLGHVTRYKFDWLYAVSPVEVTKALIDEFGIGVVNAPSAPVILICEDQSTRPLETGVKTADELKAEIAEGC